MFRIVIHTEDENAGVQIVYRQFLRQSTLWLDGGLRQGSDHEPRLSFAHEARLRAVEPGQDNELLDGGNGPLSTQVFASEHFTELTIQHRGLQRVSFVGIAPSLWSKQKPRPQGFDDGLLVVLSRSIAGQLNPQTLSPSRVVLPPRTHPAVVQAWVDKGVDVRVLMERRAEVILEADCDASAVTANPTRYVDSNESTIFDLIGSSSPSFFEYRNKKTDPVEFRHVRLVCSRPIDVEERERLLAIEGVRESVATSPGVRSFWVPARVQAEVMQFAFSELLVPPVDQYSFVRFVQWRTAQLWSCRGAGQFAWGDWDAGRRGRALRGLLLAPASFPESNSMCVNLAEEAVETPAQHRFSAVRVRKSATRQFRVVDRAGEGLSSDFVRIVEELMEEMDTTSVEPEAFAQLHVSPRVDVGMELPFRRSIFGDGVGGVVGLIDEGINAASPLLSRSTLVSLIPGVQSGSSHGTAMAEVLVGQSELFRGVVPGAALCYWPCESIRPFWFRGRGYEGRSRAASWARSRDAEAHGFVAPVGSGLTPPRSLSAVLRMMEDARAKVVATCWDVPGSRDYGQFAFECDRHAYENGKCLVVAAVSNHGDVRSPAAAKNVLSVACEGASVAKNQFAKPEIVVRSSSLHLSPDVQGNSAATAAAAGVALVVAERLSQWSLPCGPAAVRAVMLLCRDARARYPVLSLAFGLPERADDLRLLVVQLPLDGVASREITIADGDVGVSYAFNDPPGPALANKVAVELRGADGVVIEPDVVVDHGSAGVLCFEAVSGGRYSVVVRGVLMVEAVDVNLAVIGGK